ncbi:conjugal transfer protein TraF [Pseudoalteromonas phenolica]|uniref:conjugal transfer protein TraF n=1 Tax=Pseudoalteromonas phenolica TaxID=161398 RepID=UPI00110BA0B8|nr:conjugal transfer protein TraF [Pseudoalteromonas phenolica]TMO54969.1 hypothetical protein CWC21_12420 [Pseudoalteromonas phenolica]
MKKRIALALLASATSAAVSAADTRSQGMGDVGVASADYLSSVLINPALINRHSDDTDDFGLILPSANVFVRDEQELRNHIDTFQDSFDELSDLLELAESGGNVTAEQLDKARKQLSSDLAMLNGGINIEANLALALASPSRIGGFALYANTDVDANANLFISDDDVNVIANAQTPEELEELTSSLQVVGAAVSEIGFVYANQFTVSNKQVYWSVTPKFQQVDSFNYVSTINDFDEDDFDASDYTKTENNFNFDIGLATELTERVTVGLVAKNLIENDYDSVAGQGLTPSYKVGPEYIAGISYNGDVVTLAADIDLTAPQHSNLVKESQYARLGLELNAFDWVQIRAGYRHDFNGDKEDSYSLGFGLSPFGVVRLDLMAQTSGDNQLGAGLQLSFTM